MALLAPNWLDRAVGVFDPESALRRARARAALAYYSSDGGYIGTDTSRRSLRGFLARATSADAATLPLLERQRGNSRDLARNNPLAGGALATNVTAVVGTGLSVQPQILARRLGLSDDQAKAWQDDARAWFELWAERAEWADLAGRHNFYQLQAVSFMTALQSGDCFALLPQFRYGAEPLATKVQLVEADRVCNRDRATDTPEWAGGIRCDGNGRPMAVAIADRHPGEQLGAALRNQWTEVPVFGVRTGRRNVLQIGELERPGQRRGVPYLAPVMEPLKQLGTYTRAEIDAAVMSSFFTVFVKTQSGGETIGGSAMPSATAGATAANEMEMAPAAILGLAADEDVTFANPSRPNAQFDPFVQAIFEQIGTRLELPKEVLTKSFKASYSAARAALLEAWRYFMRRRQVLAWQFCQPVYEAVITEAIATGRLRAPGFAASEVVRAAWLRAVWVGDSPGAIDPEKEANAAQKRVDLGISTLDRESIAFDGGNWADKHAQQVREQQARRRDGLGQAPAAVPAAAPPAAPGRADQPEQPDAD